MPIVLLALLIVGIMHLNLQYKYISLQKKYISLKIKNLKIELGALKMNNKTAKENTSTKDSNVWKVLNVEATGYANVEECCYPYYDGKTATGRNANLPGVAVDPKVIPYGKWVKIDGLGTFLADDTGGVIKGNRIDIRFSCIEEAKEWGRQNIQVQILNQKE